MPGPPRPRLTAGSVAAAISGRVRGEEGRFLTGVATLEDAGPEDLSFLHRASYRARALASTAGCVVVATDDDLPGRTVIVAPDAHRAFALAVGLFHPEEPRAAGVSPDATVDRAAALGEGVFVGPRAVVGRDVVVGRGSAILAGAVIGDSCRVGDDCVIHPAAVLYPGTRIGDRVIVHAGAVLGSDGFGYASAASGHLKVPHVGRVVIEDDVEIGAGTCVARAVLGETRIGRGTKIDNLVQVAHNVTVGPLSLLVAQSGIAGSTRLGPRCIVAGQSGVAGHLEIGDGVRVGAKSAVFEDVEAGATVTGIPAMPHGRWKRVVAVLAKLPDVARRLRGVEERLDRLEGEQPPPPMPVE